MATSPSYSPHKVMKVEDKENAAPNLRQPSPAGGKPLTTVSEASSKAQLISARLAEWKKRMGVEPHDTPTLTSASLPSPKPSGEAQEDAEEKRGPKEGAAHPAQKPPSGRDQQGQQGCANDNDSLLVFDFSGPPKTATRPGFVPGRHSQRLLTDRARKEEEARIPARAADPFQATSSPPVDSSPDNSPAPQREASCPPHEHHPPVSSAELDTRLVSALGEVTEECFDLDLSICEADPPKSAPSPLAAPLRESSCAGGEPTTRTEDSSDTLLQAQCQEWERRYTEEHAKLGSVQALLREYERDLELVLRQHEQDELQRLQSEAEAELLAVTNSFADVKRRYDETKSINESLRKNEATLLDTLRKVEEELANSEARFEALRTQAEEKLAGASSEVQRTRAEGLQAESARQALGDALDEQTKLVAFWKARALIAEAKLPGLTQALALKEHENQELLGICDQLFASLQPPAGASEHPSSLPTESGDLSQSSE